MQALYQGKITLCLSQALLNEIKDVLSRPEVLAHAPSLTDSRLTQFLESVLRLSEWITDVPNAFSFSQHPDDDHLFNLAIAAKAELLVTWENRILQLGAGQMAAAQELRVLAPQLHIITPKQLADQIR